MTTKLKQAAPGKRPEAEKTESVTTQQGDYTPTPEEAKEHLQKYIQSLPADMRADFERFNLKMITETLRGKASLEKAGGKMLTKRMMIQLLARRANGEKFAIDHTSFTEPYKRYWQTLDNAAPGKEMQTLEAIADEKDLKRIQASKLQSPDFPALAGFQEQIKDVTWYWDYRIPIGKITVLGGEGGVSKSMLAQRICYMQIHDATFPDNTPIHNPGAPVLYVDCEGFAAGIKSRALAWGMDTSKFYLWSVDLEKDGFIDFSNPDFRDELIERINAIDPPPALVVIDSFGNASAGGQDKVEDVRDLLNFFNQIAYNFDLALILVAHTRKPPVMFAGKGEITQDDIRGSGHLINMARSAIGVWMVQTAAEPDPNGPRVMAVIKSNYGRKPKPLGYEVLSDANDNPMIFFGDAPKPYKEKSKLELCAELITDTLEAEGKPMQPKELEAIATQEGFKRDSFYAAHKLLEKDGRIENTIGQKITGNEWRLIPKLP
jgi:hypothetical protein